MVSATTKRFIRNKTDEKAVKAGYVVDRKKADHVIDFFAELRHTLGQWAGKPIELMP